VFPRNVTFREVDILRGYIAIRMLQEIDGRVSFRAPNAVQIRNAHSYHKDYLQETRLYESILRFISDLDEWVCEGGSKKNLKDCFIQCIEMLVDKKHLCQSEIEFFGLWLNDLDSIGYKWPQINSNRDPENKIKKTQKIAESVYFRSIEQEHSSNSNDNEKSIVQKREEDAKLDRIKSLCKLQNDKNIEISKVERNNNLILVTWLKSREDLVMIENILNIHFQVIVGCFKSEIPGLERISDFIVTNTTGGIALIESTNFKECVYSAINIGFNQNTFIFTKNLNLFQFWSEIKLREPSRLEQLDISSFNMDQKVT